MTWLIHGVMRQKDLPSLPAGELAFAAFGDLAGILSPMRGDADIDLVLAHNARLTELASERDIVPIRFGATAQSRERAVEILSEDASTYRASLHRIAGAVEYGLQIRQAPANRRQDVPDTGGSYLRARRAAKAAREEAREQRLRAVEEILLQIQSHVRDIIRLPVQDQDDTTQQIVANVSLLVERRAARGLLKHLECEGTRIGPGGLSLRVSGPWPAYSFSHPGEAA